ncbi:MAG: NAD-dependent epimerase/dehydratase family protein, partial [Candidatus Omnitrophica bacterium]|nr:NAD-dependent epimerase/dehydratase family protein [Candidatus Omnitrophota bacterium]
MKSKIVLVTGGAGYIGSHMVRALSGAGYRVVVFDNLSTGHRQLVPRGVPFHKGDIRNPKALAAVFAAYKIDAVVHFAGLIAVGESVVQPLSYYDNNVAGSLRLLEAGVAAKVKCFVFSSTAAVYGPSRTPRFSENAVLAPGNPYGASKLMLERIIADTALSTGLRFMLLRYFNASGASADGSTGEW